MLSLAPRLLTGTTRVAAERRTRNICCRRQPAAAAAVDRWDRQTDRRTPERYIDPAPHTMREGSVNSDHRTRNESDGIALTCRDDAQVVRKLGYHIDSSIVVLNKPAQCAARNHN